MKLDEKILEVLRDNMDSYVSGEELSGDADISRAAIWKHIEKLREEGYEIEAIPHVGYRLVRPPDAMLASEIKWKLKASVIGKQIMSYKKTDSTNDVAYELAEKGMAEGAVVVAEEQTKGKGRHGRSWVSPSKYGIYMSCILRPEMAPSEISKITLLAAVAVANALNSATTLSTVIKWPNDILADNKKICGILTEMKAEQDMIDFIILGIGVNVNTPARFLPKGAGSIKEALGAQDDLSRVEIARNILEKLDHEYKILKREGFGPIMAEWKRMSHMLGERVRVVTQTRSLEGLVHDIDENGSLVLRLDSGILARVSSGDIIMLR